MSNQPKPKDELVVGLDPVAAADVLRERRAYQTAPLIVPGMMRGAIAKAARTTGRLGPLDSPRLDAERAAESKRVADETRALLAGKAVDVQGVAEIIGAINSSFAGRR